MEIVVIAEKVVLGRRVKIQRAGNFPDQIVQHLVELQLGFILEVEIDRMKFRGETGRQFVQDGSLAHATLAPEHNDILLGRRKGVLHEAENVLPPIEIAAAHRRTGDVRIRYSRHLLFSL